MFLLYEDYLLQVNITHCNSFLFFKHSILIILLYQHFHIKLWIHKVQLHKMQSNYVINHVESSVYNTTTHINPV